MRLLFEDHTIAFQDIHTPELHARNIGLTIARLDLIHPVVSGNKLFKLHYFLEEAVNTGKRLITFGGAFSNHLAATAFAANNLGLRSVGFVRDSTRNSHTLDFCIANGMELIFMSRSEYRKINDPDFLKRIEEQFNHFVIIPEGGYEGQGAKGAGLILPRIKPEQFTHICTAVGTATTIAGLLKYTKHAQIVGIPVIKNMKDLPERLHYLIDTYDLDKLLILNDYHFGGYAKADQLLFSFMNHFYEDHHVPLDFVYTGKLLFGIMNAIGKGVFNEGSKILCLHTGGLQGNLSLPAGTLIY